MEETQSKKRVPERRKRRAERMQIIVDKADVRQFLTSAMGIFIIGSSVYRPRRRPQPQIIRCSSSTTPHLETEERRRAIYRLRRPQYLRIVNLDEIVHLPIEQPHICRLTEPTSASQLQPRYPNLETSPSQLSPRYQHLVNTFSANDRSSRSRAESLRVGAKLIDRETLYIQALEQVDSPSSQPYCSGLSALSRPMNTKRCWTNTKSWSTQVSKELSSLQVEE